MTIREYLEILNNCIIEDDMDYNLIKNFGLVDIIPELDKGFSRPEIDYIKNGIISITRRFEPYTKIQPKTKLTNLNDPLGLHGEFQQSEKEVIEETIIGLQEMPGDFEEMQTKINKFQEYLEYLNTPSKAQSK